jgi:hypothetical protein
MILLRSTAVMPTRTLFTAAAALLLGACAEIPTAPTITVMPAPYKPF